MTLINYQMKSLAFNQIYSSNFYQLKSLFNFLCYSHITVTFQRSKRASFSGQFISYFLGNHYFTKIRFNCKSKFWTEG